MGLGLPLWFRGLRLPSVKAVGELTRDKMDLPGGSDDKESACNAGDLGSIPGSGRSPGEGNGNPLKYSCLGISLDRGAWWAAVHGISKSRTELSQ